MDTEVLLSYGPGDVIISFADQLAHRVSRWTPEPSKVKCDDTDETPAQLTPGRVGSVFYTHKNVLEYLKDKKPDWFIQTLRRREERKRPRMGK